MSVVIRMKRTGRRNRPCYRITVADRRSPRDGRMIENLGLYDPISKVPEAQVTLNVERAQHWVGLGAQPSDTVRSIFKRHGVYEGVEQTTTKRVRKRTQTAKRKKRDVEDKARMALKVERATARKTAKREAAKAAKAAEAAAEGGDE